MVENRIGKKKEKCVNIGVRGVEWISGTSNIQDLILNAVALVLVLDVDELIFTTLMPRRMQEFADECSPIKTAHHRKTSRLFTVVYLSYVFGITIYAYFLSRDIAMSLSAVKDVLCNGTIDFAIGVQTDGYVGLKIRSTSSPVTSYFYIGLLLGCIDADCASKY